MLLALCNIILCNCFNIYICKKLQRLQSHPLYNLQVSKIRYHKSLSNESARTLYKGQYIFQICRQWSDLNEFVKHSYRVVLKEVLVYINFWTIYAFFGTLSGAGSPYLAELSACKELASTTKKLCLSIF